MFEAARERGLILEDCMVLCNLLEKEESAQDESCEYDKESLTTINQLTKMGDNASESYEI